MKSFIKKIFLYVLVLSMLLSFTLLSVIKVNGASSSKFYTIFCNPAEDSSKAMQISWHTDEEVTDSYVVYTKKTDVNWENSQKVIGTYEYNNTFLRENAIGKGFNQNSATITNLESGTEYMYKITDGSEESTVRYFKTGSQSFSFIWVSDFHAYSGGTRLQNATENIEEAIKINGGADFIFSTGDIVAHGGTYDWWKQVSGANWISNYMFCTTLGNHDWMTKNGTYVENGASSDYQKSCQNNPKNGYEGQENVCYYFYYGDALFVVLNTEEFTQDQYDWAENVLKNANSQYIFLVQHYQAFNNKGGMNKNGYTRWHELCDKYGVDIFFSGNSHVYVRSKSLYEGEVSTDESKGTVYMVAPSSDGERGVAFTGFTSNTELLDAGWGEGLNQAACSIVNVTGDGITTRLVNKDGEILDSSYVKAKRPASSRITKDLSSYNKEEFEGKINLNKNSKDYSKPRISIPREAYDLLRSIKLYDETTGKVYFDGKTPFNNTLIELEGFNQGLLDLKLELNYYDDELKILDISFDNTPKWGKLSNIKVESNNESYVLSWKENVDKTLVKNIEIYLNGSLYDTIEFDVCQISLKDLSIGENKVTLKIKGNDDALYAQYEETIENKAKTWTVSFYDKDGNLIETINVKNGEAATVPTAPKVEGYKFSKWDKDFTNVTSDLNIKAIYEKEIKEYTVKFLDNDGNILKEEIVKDGGKATAPQTPNIEGYEFVKWDTDFNGVKGDLIVKPIYNEIKKEKSGCGSSASIMFTSLMLLGLVFIKRKNLFN